MGLISKEAALAAIDHEREMLIEQRLLGAEHVVVHHARRLIEDMQTVPAVPLDKLCEWLADNYEPPANVSNGKALDNHEFCVTLWRYVLEKMMEEQDAKEET